MVFLDGKYVGKIRRMDGGWQYFPKGDKQGGQVFKKLSECENSLND